MSAVDVSLKRDRAVVEYDPRTLAIQSILEAIQGTVVLPQIRRAIERIARPRRGRPPG